MTYLVIDFPGALMAYDSAEKKRNGFERSINNFRSREVSNPPTTKQSQAD